MDPGYEGAKGCATLNVPLAGPLIYHTLAARNACTSKGIVMEYEIQSPFLAGYHISWDGGVQHCLIASEPGNDLAATNTADCDREIPIELRQ